MVHDGYDQWLSIIIMTRKDNFDNFQHLQRSGTAGIEPAAGRQVCRWWEQQVSLVLVVIVVVMMLTMTSIIAMMTIDHHDADNDDAGGKRRCRAQTRLGVDKAAKMAV